MAPMGSVPGEGATMRLFLALMPPPALRARLGELADAAHARCGGRRMPDESLHATLAFLGEVEARRADELALWVAGLSVAPGLWRLNAWGRFDGPGILWAGGGHIDPDLQRLHDGLWHELETRGLGERPARFVPHVTLLRRARHFDTAGLPDIRLDWAYNRLELIRSIPGERRPRYVSLAQSQRP